MGTHPFLFPITKDFGGYQDGYRLTRHAAETTIAPEWTQTVEDKQATIRSRLIRQPDGC